VTYGEHLAGLVVDGGDAWVAAAETATGVRRALLKAAVPSIGGTLKEADGTGGGGRAGRMLTVATRTTSLPSEWRVVGGEHAGWPVARDLEAKEGWFLFFDDCSRR